MDDLISRKSVLKAIGKLHVYGFTTIDEDNLKEAIKKLKPFIPNKKSEYDHDHAVAKAYNDGQAFILDKIRAEIENDWQLKEFPSSPWSCGLRRAIEIIDKYREVSE